MSVVHKKKEDCCGCNACAEICPKHCIEMIKDKKGFFYPRIKEDLCVECGACERVCPLLLENQQKKEPITAYAAWSNNPEIYFSSSSGGVAYILSKYIIENQGVVYGCSAEGINIKHIRVEKLEDLYKLQGSKYVQSDVRGVFKRVKNDLNHGTSVLFIGTPCQVAGLRNYIKNIPENLFLIDIICHGVPSLQMLKEHVFKIVKDRKVEKLSFRKGSKYELSIHCNDLDYKSEICNDSYYKGFFEGFINRQCCYKCSFACKRRVSDITIGDFWGLSDAESLPIDVKDGVSVLLPCTDNGLNLIHGVSTTMSKSERSVEEAVSGNSQLQRPLKFTFRCKIFQYCYPIFPFDTAVCLSILDLKVKSFIRLIVGKIKYDIRK